MHSKHLRGLALALAASMILLGGCESRPESAQSAAQVSLPEPEVEADAMFLGEQQGERWQDVALYYISADGASLSPDFRTLHLEDGETLAGCALRELLSPPGGTDQLSIVPGDTRLLALELSGGVATVHLSIDARSVQTEQELYLMYAAISATLLEIDGITGVNVLIGGQSESVFRLPVGLLSATSDNAAAMLAQLQTESERFLGSDRSARGTLTRDVLLYFPTTSGQYLVPEVHTIEFADENYAYALIEALKSGPLGTDNYVAPMPDGLEILAAMPSVSISGQGMRILDLNFNSMLSSYLTAARLSPSQFAASVTLTMCSFLPELDGVRIAIDGEAVTELQSSGSVIALKDGLHTREVYSDRIGAMTSLYFAGENGGLSLHERVVAQEYALSPRLMLEQLFAEPGSEQLRSALPEGTSAQDVLGVRLENGVAHVNLSGNFYRRCQLMDDQQERNAVYAIVNTLCRLEQINGVRIYIEGSAADLMVGSIYLRSMLMYNPGIVEN